MNVKCFMISKTERLARWLRRYGGTCPGPYGYHNAMVRIEDGPRILTPEGYIEAQWHPLDDPRWPTSCDHCGATIDWEKSPEVPGQLFTVDIYQTPEGKDVSIHSSDLPGIEQAPAGSLFYSTWCPGPKKHAGPYLWCMLPNHAGPWCIDGDSTNGPGWNRTGEPPDVTVTPSILVQGKYHGFLTKGELVSC